MRRVTRHSKFSLSPAQASQIAQLASTLPPDKAYDFRLAVSRVLTVSAVGFVTNDLLQLAIEVALAEVNA